MLRVAIDGERSVDEERQEIEANSENNEPAQAKDPEHKPRKKRWPKRVAIAFAIVAALAVVSCTGFAIYASDYYHASETVEGYFNEWENEAASAPEGSNHDAGDVTFAASSDQLTTQQAITESDGSIAVGSPTSEYGFVLYPGAKVEPAAYIPLAEKLADLGVYCVVVEAPFNFAFFDANAADAIMNATPAVKHWWIGGHSLGGVVAASYAVEHADKLEGIALLAAYSTSDLKDKGLNAITLYGSNDLVVNRENLTKCAKNLPDASQTVVIEGGNHAGFGDYGTQAGDGEATISAADQQTIAASTIAEAMRENIG